MTTSASHLVLPVGTRDHVRGPAVAPVTLLEYGDYECPYCGAAHPVVQEVRRLMGDQLRFAFRHFPLSNVHPHAEPAANAAEGAGVQHRFWEMHDLLFENQDALEHEDLIEYAEAIGLDVARFTRELLAGTHAARVKEDFLSGVRSGVNGTPTFYINDIRHDGGYDVRSLMLAVTQALES
jgi:protein-disulfide isomerase